MTIPIDPVYYHGDAQGSIVGVSNPAGVLTATNRYDAWGNVTANTGTTKQYGYSGREPSDNGLVYYRSRYYDPQIGRFTQMDPKGFIDGVNRYTYVLNSPVNYVDPWGTNANLFSFTDNNGGYAAIETYSPLRAQEYRAPHIIEPVERGFLDIPVIGGIATALGDQAALFNDGVNPFSGEILSPRRLQDAKFFTFIDAALLGTGSGIRNVAQGSTLITKKQQAFVGAALLSIAIGSGSQSSLVKALSKVTGAGLRSRAQVTQVVERAQFTSSQRRAGRIVPKE